MLVRALSKPAVFARRYLGKVVLRALSWILAVSWDTGTAMTPASRGHAPHAGSAPRGTEGSTAVCSGWFSPGHPAVPCPMQEPVADADCQMAFQAGCAGRSGFPCRNLSPVSAVAAWLGMVGGSMGPGTPAVLS